MVFAVGLEVIADVGVVADPLRPFIVKELERNRGQVHVQVVAHHVRQRQVFGVRGQVDALPVDGDMELGVLVACRHGFLVQQLLAQLAVGFGHGLTVFPKL